MSSCSAQFSLTLYPISNPEITAAAVENGAVVKDVFPEWTIHCKDTEIQQAILNS